MQREKLYSLQSKIYFGCALFVFRQSKILCEHFSQRRNLMAQNVADFEQKSYNCKFSCPM
jgi:hypothetical protein